ncbi:hypothetical protein [Aeromonas fluvialis]|uniref:hypothetical protein n=1 Tax=Aeromonas fluvialis TaxID=591962 RepID=UPI000A85CDE6|nr:hypothetical protein [Aeromonas fluvialis]
MQLERLDISLSHYHQLDREHRAHILLLGGLMLAIMALHLLLLPHFPYERVHAISLGFEVLNWIIMLFLFWVVQCAHLPICPPTPTACSPVA